MFVIGILIGLHLKYLITRCPIATGHTIFSEFDSTSTAADFEPDRKKIKYSPYLFIQKSVIYFYDLIRMESCTQSRFIQAAAFFNFIYLLPES